MEQSIHFGARGHANASLSKRGKRLVGRVAAVRLERVRDWARSKIAALSARRSHPATFPVVCCVGMALLWAHLNGYLSLPVSVCDWTALLGK
ncbi:hypothetical protein KTE91_31300 [Burkholderia multivorans]|uniref:hypothetical protein n=1 Tax=Burkholderia multivorans TaxID=87883 RepID=UPI001C2215B9|nr:hypothetical protein [Burkholderia multivorans]MBU9439565.1 hypothetical protein [Burkholderia multivorans]